MTLEKTERIVFVYTTYPSVVEAEKAGRILLETQLAACVNIIPGMISLYRWNGALERGEEAVMIIKTRASLADEVTRAVRENHPYDTPAILVIPIESVDAPYVALVTGETPDIRSNPESTFSLYLLRSSIFSAIVN